MPGPSPRSAGDLFARGTWAEVRRIGDILRTETVGGALLLVAALVALLWANSPWSSTYQEVRDWRLGPTALHLDLTAAQWATDGLLAVFFFVAALELKREFVAGDLRTPRRAILPVAGAIGGMAVPALLYAVINLRAADLGLPEGSPGGWAIPTATDIAFALAVLAVIGTHLPAALRTFLLALAVVDDLFAIVIIAVFYTSSLQLLPLALALLPLAVFAVLVHLRVRLWWLLLPLAVLTWSLVHASGIHATVAGVALAFTVPVTVRDRDQTSPDEQTSGLVDQFEHRLRPISAGIAVPVFAFFAAGVPLATGASLLAGIQSAARDPVTVGVVAGLVFGKCMGILAAIWIVRRTTWASLGGVSWWDLLGIGLLGGIGFTVALLIGELAFGPDNPRGDHARLAILAGSLVSALAATLVLRLRNRHYRQLREAEERDTDLDGVPDLYQTEHYRTSGT